MSEVNPVDTLEKRRAEIHGCHDGEWQGGDECADCSIAVDFAREALFDVAEEVRQGSKARPGMSRGEAEGYRMAENDVLAVLKRHGADK